MNVRLEVCVDDAAGLAVAVAAGADRIELCAALALGGLTPGAGLMVLAAKTAVPVFAMIRPRAGDFCWSSDEVAVMSHDIAAARAAGLAGVVLGASLPDGRLDREVLGQLVGQAAGLGLTLHRCFDLVPDPFEALEMAIDLGFQRILTSGLAPTAAEGAGLLAQLVKAAAGRIVIMPGAGVGPETVGALAGVGYAEIHASCASPVAQAGPAVALGFAPPVARQTDAARIRALRKLVSG
ncbi:copper homeostasis protein CutC [Pseudotabrizicola sp. L79]|uniref:copper homeostasis protein CutC n=1 Tax=Pseudotabrizicola sp. L79 TaxID=3118402 RepID=UPI002F930504